MFKRIPLIVLSLIFLIALGLMPAVAQDNAPYKDASLSPEQRADDLLARMTTEEKIGQMTLVEKGSINPDDITDLFIGGLLSGGGGSPPTNTAEAWAKMVDDFQAKALATRLGIPVIYGADGVHGHNNLRGAVIFPHNIGMGATRDPDLMEKVCNTTAQEMMATGIYWNYAPVVAVAQDIRWGRIYESFSENTDVVSEMAAACIKGMQSGSPYVVATPKHFVGDGGTAWDSSTTGDYSLDQGVTEVDEATLRAIHLPPYKAAIDAGAQTIMVSFSSWGGMKMSAQKYLITDVLKGELGFKGFVVSDWQAIDQISGNYYADNVTSFNAGMDMSMVPYDYHKFIDTMKKAIDSGDIPMTRVDDAVRRILLVKFQMGLFEHPYSQPDLLADVGSDAHREIARQAVAESLVLLKNDHAALPIAKDTPRIFVAGEGADSIGIQTGGWTITWQGQASDVTPGTTILDAIKATVSADTDVKFDRFGNFKNAKDDAGNLLNADVGIVVISENPYAEGVGDSDHIDLTNPQADLIEKVRARVGKLIVVTVSGRPLVITDELDAMDAVVAAWLPGTEGQGVADVLFGDKPFVGKLSFTWPRSEQQLPFDFKNLPTEGDGAPLFPFGYGLTTS
ncbi:MAG: glycoside hydrolase family 3 N-terminal domain-containing protein [Chloroflexota bacterium]